MKTFTSRTSGITFVATAGLLCACAGQPQHVDDDAPPAAPERQIVRHGASIAQGGILFARSFHVDPVNRPVSNLMSLGSYAIKSAGGLLHRAVIGTAQFPSLESQAMPELSYAEGMDLVEWEKELTKITGQESSHGTIEFLVDGEEYFPRMLDAINQARQSIDIRTYIFDNDDFATGVADELKRLSSQVDVRIMIDGIGNLMAMRTHSSSMPADFRTPLSIERYLERESKVRVRTLSNPWLTGDHTKTTIIDKKVAFLGGMNIGREYRYEWHDLMMEVRGPVVDQLQRDTNKAWAKASVFGDVARIFAYFSPKESNAGKAGYPVRALYTRNFDSQIYRAQLAAFRHARSYILIENGYFSDDATLYELARARRRGVDVRVILPEDGNHGSHDSSNLVAVNKMLRNGIRVYRYPGMTHIKAAVIDGWASVGTANFDKLSLQVNKEVNLATSETDTVNELLDRVFIPDLNRSVEIREMYDIPLQARIIEFIADEAL